MLVTAVFALILIGISGTMLDMHRRTWLGVQQDATQPTNERRYARSQYRRRMQASGIIGSIGAAIGCGPLVPRQPIAMALYLLAIVGACLVLILLAVFDAWSTRQHVARLRGELLANQAKLAHQPQLVSGARNETSQHDFVTTRSSSTHDC